MGLVRTALVTGAAGTSGLAAGAVMWREHVMPRDRWGEFDMRATARLGLAELAAGAAGGVAALAARHRHPRAALAGAAAAAALAGIGAATWLITDTGTPAAIFGARFRGTADSNASGRRRPDPGREHRYEPRAGDLLPDGVPQHPSVMFVRPEALGGTALHFSTTVANLGHGPLELARTDTRDGSHGIRQIVRGADGHEHSHDVEGRFAYHPRHRHVHFDDWVQVQLLATDASGRPTREVERGKKLSFNITDGDRVAPELDVDPALRRRRGIGDRPLQGVSPGFADTYGPLTPGQSLDVDDLRPGTYVLRTTFDPHNRIAESDEANNVRDTRLRITRDAVGLLHVERA